MLARLHSLLGVAALGGYLLYHLGSLWPVQGGAQAWVRAHPEGGTRLAVALAVLVLMVVHALLGLRRGKADGLSGSDGLARLQAITGAMVLAFVAYHVVHVWGYVSAGGGSAAPHDGYAVLWRELGRPVQLGIYVVGVTAACFHLGHGLSRVPQTWGLPIGVTVARLAAGGLAFVLWVVLLHMLSHFALGEGLLSFGGGGPDPDLVPRR